MGRCQCYKRDGRQCTRKGSKRPQHLAIYCWQHQKCHHPLKSEQEQEQEQEHELELIHQPTQLVQRRQSRELAPQASATFSPSLSPQSSSFKIKSTHIKEFIQQSDRMLALDPHDGIEADEEKSTLLEGVVPGLWEIELEHVVNQNGELVSLKSLTARASEIRTDFCEWKKKKSSLEYEGIILSNSGWLGLFDYSVLLKKKLTEITKETKPINHFHYGVSLYGGQPREYEVLVCYDVNGHVVGIKIK